jgi:hypothetical protein
MLWWFDLQRVVEHRRVRAVRIDDRQDLAHVVAERLAAEQRLAGVHPVGVAAHGVDLAVVRDVAVRVRAIPARERVGAEARVHERQRGFHQRIAEIREIRRELHRRQHSFVDERLVRQAGDVPARGAFQRRRADLGVGPFADDVQLALERQLIRDRRIATHEHLPHERLARLRGVAEHRVVARDGAPAEHGLAFGLHDLLEALFDASTQRRIARQEHDAAAIRARLRQLDARFLARFGEEPVRHLDQHAGAVAAVFLGAAGAAVIEIHEDLQALLQDAVGLAALDVDHEADAAGVVLERRVVQALLRRQSRPAGSAPFTAAAHHIPRVCIQLSSGRLIRLRRARQR